MKGSWASGYRMFCLFDESGEDDKGYLDVYSFLEFIL